MSKPLSLTPARRRKFLDALSETGDVSAAAKAAGLSRGEALRLREEDESFRSVWDDANESAVDALEAEARRRALEGDEEDIYYRGEVVGTKIRKSDGMLEFLLKAYRPEKFASKTASKAAHDRTGVVAAPFKSGEAREELARRIASIVRRGRSEPPPSGTGRPYHS